MKRGDVVIVEIPYVGRLSEATMTKLEECLKAALDL